MIRRKKSLQRRFFLFLVFIVFFLGVFSQKFLREQYWIWKLENKDPIIQEIALNKLSELQSVRAIPRMMDALAQRMGEWDYSIAERVEGDLTLHSSDNLPLLDFFGARARFSYGKKAFDESSLKAFKVKNNQAGIQILKTYFNDPIKSKRLMSISAICESMSEAKKFLKKSEMIPHGSHFFTISEIKEPLNFSDVPNVKEGILVE